MSVIEHPQTLPEAIEAQIAQLVSRTGNSKEVILQEYLRVFKMSIQQVNIVHPNLSADEKIAKAQTIAISTVWNQIVNMPPVNNYDIVYLGTSGMTVAKGSKRASATLFLGLREGTGLKIYRLSSDGKYAGIYKVLNPLNIYTAVLARRRSAGGVEGDFTYDGRCSFGSPRPQSLDVYALCQILNTPIVTIEQAKANPSKTKSDGFVDPCDWRCILGNFSGPPRINNSKDDAGNVIELDGQPVKYGRCTITDLTVKETAYQDAKNFTVYPGIDCYAAPEFLQAQSENDYAAFLGAVSNKKDEKTGQVKTSMKAGLIMPIFSMSQGIEER
jgi:hypothetical protein